MKKEIKKLTATLLLSSQIFILGCGGSDIAKLELISPTTKQEVLDYFSKALKYKAVVSRGADEVKETKYVERAVSDSIASKLKDKQGEVHNILSSMEYNKDSKNIISEDVFHYIKAYLNDLKLDNPKIEDEAITEALGYYFVDVVYDTKQRSSGSLTDIASLLAVKGAFREDSITGEVSKDDYYIQTAVDKANLYFATNKIEKHLEYDDINTFRILDGSPSIAAYFNASEVVTNEFENTTVNNVNEEINQDNMEESVEPEAESNTETTNELDNGLEADSESNETTINSDSGERKIKFDAYYLSEIIGSSTSQSSIMPKLDMVYNIPSPEGAISGIGIYPSGTSGMKQFNYDNESMSGTITIRYVYKDENELQCVNAYVKSMENNIGKFDTESNVLVPDYIMKELENVIERADRVVVNYDLRGLISNNIFDDMGFGVLRGYMESGARINKCVSNIRSIVARDIDSKSYLLDVETLVVEGARSANTYGTFIDRSYFVVQQIGPEFKITDWLRVSRVTEEEPDIDYGNSAIKRLVSLSLAGEVEDNTKKEATKLLGELYRASTDRKLYGPYEYVVDGETKTIEKGMYDCFNKDVNLLSSDNKEEMNAKLRQLLTAYGSNTMCEYTGKIDQWIGGSKNQVEFTAEEVMIYENGKAGKYLRTYYLMSAINDVWYIDQITNIEVVDLEPDEIESAYNRLASE